MRKSYIVLSLLLTMGLVFASCGKATPTTTKATIPPTTLAPTTTVKASTPVPTTAPKTATAPKLLTWATLDVGSSSYNMTAQGGEAVRDKTGVPVRIIPVGNDLGRVTLARSGSVQMVTLSDGGYLVREGIQDYANRAWGPQRMRMLYQLNGGSANGAIVRGNSKFNTASDLKGAKIPFVLGLPGHNQGVEAVLAFGGLTWADVTRVELPSYAASLDAVIDGKTDIYYGAPNSAGTLRISTGPGGVRYLPLPRADKEGWKRFNAVSPAALPSTVTEGPGLSAANPYEGTAQPQLMDAYDFLDDDIAYFTTKAWAESSSIYKARGGRLAFGDLQYVLDVVGIVRFAFHPGSIKYFKEVGKWTPQLEAWNSKVLEREAKLLKAWEACLAEADASKLTEDKLPALWDKYRKDIPMIQP